VLASGETLQRWKDFDVFAYERLSGPHLLVALNNDSAGPRTIRVDTGFGANVGLHDYTGHSGDVATDGAGVVTLTVPPNRGGLGYLCYSRQGQDRALNPGAHSVTQDFEGATDLDILPCIDGGTVLTGRIWCATGSQIEATPEIDRTGWSAKTQVAFELLDPDLTLKANVTVTETSPRGATLRATANAEGFHTLRVTASDLPATNPEPPYKLSVRYTAPRDFAAVQPVAADPAKVGRWSERFALPNAPIHTHLLPNGKCCSGDGGICGPEHSTTISARLRSGIREPARRPPRHSRGLSTVRPSTCFALATPGCPTASCWLRVDISRTAWALTKRVSTISRPTHGHRCR
jgi:Alpha-amylase C-terminal